MTVASTLLALGTLPLLLFIWAEPFTDTTFTIPYGSIVLSLVLVVIPVALGITIRTKMRWLAKYLEVGATVLGVIFIIVALIYGAITESAIFAAPGSIYATGIIMFVFGAVVGYFMSLLVGLRRYQARTAAIETSIQNTTLALSIMTLTYVE